MPPFGMRCSLDVSPAAGASSAVLNGGLSYLRPTGSSSSMIYSDTGVTEMTLKFSPVTLASRAGRAA
jgi:hypothetical protein